MSLSKPEEAPSAWCYVFTKFCNVGAGGTRALITGITVHPLSVIKEKAFIEIPHAIVAPCPA